ncbi:M48 family metalloprotease [Pelagibacterales bacterium SAG-MED31]|nr:M48 family metalloprotease [Pelagibacterales bacterium SAG-MED31]
MVLKKIIFLIFLCFAFFSNTSNSNQIFDYETEVFLDRLLLNIKTVNKFNKDIKIHIIKDTNPNAFVVANNKLIISSGLLEESPDYVALLAVLAHEVGHLEYYHLEKRKDTLEKFAKINLLSNLALISGSILSDEPQVLGGTIASQANINNFYFSFSREQEREADIYSIKTIEKLNLPSNSIKELLRILEKNAVNKGFDEEYQKFSTHPIFKERYEIVEYNSKEKLSTFDENIQHEFDFIKAKFMAYNNNLNTEMLNNDQKIYYQSINNSRSGDLEQSLKKINFLINKFPENIFFLETKGDILRSHGYLNESSRFYQIVLNNFPDNYYIKYKIFLDTNLKKFKNKDKNNFFKNNTDLLILFPNNKYIISKLKEIAINLNKINWINFFNIINQKDYKKIKQFNNKLVKLSKKTNDKELKKIINKYIKL